METQFMEKVLYTFLEPGAGQSMFQLLLINVDRKFMTQLLGIFD